VRVSLGEDMATKYSDRRPGPGLYLGGMSALPGPVLALDSGSPRVSVALGRHGEVIAERSAEIARSSTFLLRMIGEVLAEAGLAPADLGGVAALAGPGSFTGLRIGLATAFGLHQALGIAATAIPTLAALAAFAAFGSKAPAGTGHRTFAAIDVLRGEWAIQVWENGGSGPLEILSETQLARRVGEAPTAVVGFGVSRLGALPDWPAGALLVEPGPLAPVALRLLPRDTAAWDPGPLTAPIYGRPPAVTVPRPRAASAARAAGAAR
jgi:tRNA threonylcarbamoyl adenosine modification protein YeaZ